jgi:molybdenum cofactor cytidylyltransferase
METPTQPAAGIVLAAGTSSRMGGRNKLLLEVGGEPLARRVVWAALAAGLDPVVVVLGHEAERVRDALAGLACRTVHNAGYEAGMTTSLRAGVAALPEGTPAAVMILADMPQVTAGMLAELAAAESARRPPLVLSDYEGVLAPPTLFDRALFPELLALPDDRCPRSVVKRHRNAAAVLRWPASALADLDRPEDLSAVG